MDYENNNYTEEMELNEVEETEIEAVETNEETTLEPAEETEENGSDLVKTLAIGAAIVGGAIIVNKVRKNWGKIKAWHRDRKIAKSIMTLEKNGFDVNKMFVEDAPADDIEFPDEVSEDVDND